MNNQFSGIFSLILILVSVVTGFIAILQQTIIGSIFYFALILLSVFAITYSFCAKCDCRLDCCGHVFPGKLTQLYPFRQDEGYKFWDYAGTLSALIILLGFPQFWLWKTKLLFPIFWGIFFIAVMIIKLSVCNTCQNQKCPMCKKECFETE